MKALSAILLAIILIVLFIKESVSEPYIVKIGVSLPLTGALAPEGNSFRKGYEWWVEKVNHEGGLLGRKVELIVYDNHGSPDNSIQQYTKLISQDRVEFLLSPVSYRIINSIIDPLKYNKFPLITSDVIPQTLIEKTPYILPMLGLSENIFEGIIDIASQNKLNTIAIIAEDTPTISSLFTGTLKIAKDKGMEIVISRNIPPRVADFSGFIYEVKNYKIDLVLAHINLPNVIQLIKQMGDLRIHPRMFASTIAWQPNFYTALSKLGEYRFGISQWEPDERLHYPQINYFKETFLAKWNLYPDWYSAAGAGSGLLIEQAIKDIKSFDREKIFRVLKEMDTTTFFGRYKLSKEGLQIGHRPLLIQWQKGRKEIIWPKEFSTSKALICKKSCPGWPDCCF